MFWSCVLKCFFVVYLSICLYFAWWGAFPRMFIILTFFIFLRRKNLCDWNEALNYICLLSLSTCLYNRLSKCMTKFVEDKSSPLSEVINGLKDYIYTSEYNYICKVFFLSKYWIKKKPQCGLQCSIFGCPCSVL
jgi:hypothetical protein